MAIASTTWVETLAGRLRAKDLQPGMFVFGMDGLPTKIKSIQTYIPQQQFYVQFSDGSNLEGDQHLTFPARTFAQRVNEAKRKDHSKPPRRRSYKYITTADLHSTGVKHPRQPKRHMYSVDTISPLHYGTEDHAVPPFVAGMWFARTNTTGRYRVPPHLREYAKQNIQATHQFTVVQKPKHLEIRPSIEAMFLKDYATIPTDVFPYKYLYGNPEQRLAFLQGYMTVRHDNYDLQTDRFSLSARPKHLYRLEMIQVLCESLGIKTTLQKDSWKYELTFRTRLPLLPYQQHNPRNRRFGERHRHITRIEPTTPTECVHIETDKPIAVADSFIPTWHSHLNNKSS